MKYLILSVLSLPLIAACSAQSEFDSYAPPPPRAEVYRYQQPAVNHHGHSVYPNQRGAYARPGTPTRSTHSHGHGHNQVIVPQNSHGHGHNQVIVPQNNHGHNQMIAPKNAHGHSSDASSNVKKYSSKTETQSSNVTHDHR